MTASCFSAELIPARPTTSGSPTRSTCATRPAPPCIKTPGFRGMSHRCSRPARRKKKPRGRELTSAEKVANRKLAKLRVRVEHAIAGVKRSRIVKDVFRNKKPELSDAPMEAACGLHNLRVRHRRHRSKT